MKSAASDPDIQANGDQFIVAELQQVRLIKRLHGGLPSLQQGRMYFDYDTAKVRVAAVDGGVA